MGNITIVKLIIFPDMQKLITLGGMYLAIRKNIAIW